MELLFLFVPIIWWHNKSQYKHGSDPLNICEFIKVVEKSLGKVYLHIVFNIPPKSFEHLIWFGFKWKGVGLVIDPWWPRPNVHIAFINTKVNLNLNCTRWSKQSLIRAWWLHWIQYPYHDLKINRKPNFLSRTVGETEIINSD